MRVKQDEPFEIQPRANAALARVLRTGTVVALVAALAGVTERLLGVPGARLLAWSAFVIVVTLPLGRVGLLGFRWIARGDYIFAMLAFILLGIVVVGGVLAVVL